MEEAPQTYPAMAVIWNEELKDVALQFDNTHFPNWGFVIAVLDMAKRKAETQMKLQEMRVVQQQQMEAAQAQAIKKQIFRK